MIDQKKREEKEHNKDLLDTLAAASADFANVYKRTMDMLRKRDEILRDMKQTENAAKMELLKETKDVIEMLNNNGKPDIGHANPGRRHHLEQKLIRNPSNT